MNTNRKSQIESVPGELSLADLAEVRGGRAGATSLAAVKAKVEAGSDIKSESTDAEEGGLQVIQPGLFMTR